MISYHKNYRIVTEPKGIATYFDVYAPTQYGGRCETSGFLLNDIMVGDDEAFAQYHCKDLIDRGFETVTLSVIRTMPKY